MYLYFCKMQNNVLVQHTVRTNMAAEKQPTENIQKLVKIINTVKTV